LQGSRLCPSQGPQGRMFSLIGILTLVGMIAFFVWLVRV
jgi:hypothetical protein